MEAYGRLPLSFEANRGQEAARVAFLVRGSDYRISLGRRGEISLRLARSGHRSTSAAELRVKLRGANRAPRVRGREELPGRTHYLIGNDRSGWLTDIPSYARVEYSGIYPGVDLVYYGSATDARQLEYDLVVAPGGIRA